MEAILEKFSGKIDARGVITMVEDIKREYLGDALQKEDIPPGGTKLVKVKWGRTRAVAWDKQSETRSG